MFVDKHRHTHRHVYRHVYGHDLRNIEPLHEHMCVCVRACMHVCMRVCVCAIDSDETLATQEVHPQSHNVECARTYIYACGTA